MNRSNLAILLLLFLLSALGIALRMWSRDDPPPPSRSENHARPPAPAAAPAAPSTNPDLPPPDPPVPAPPEPPDASDPPEPPAAPRTVTQEWQRFRSLLGNVRSKQQHKNNKVRPQEHALVTQQETLARMLKADPAAAAPLLADVTAEKNGDLQLSLARSLQSAAPGLRSDLGTLALSSDERSRAVAAAVMGSPSDAIAFYQLDRLAWSDASELVRRTAVESLGADPRRYAAWSGTVPVEESLRWLAENDPSEAVRLAARSSLETVQSGVPAVPAPSRSRAPQSGGAAPR